MVSIRPLISKSTCPCSNHLLTVPSAPITIGITVTFMLHRFFSSLAKSWYLSLFSLSFSFTLLTITRFGRLTENRWSVCIIIIIIIIVVVVVVVVVVAFPLVKFDIIYIYICVYEYMHVCVLMFLLTQVLRCTILYCLLFCSFSILLFYFKPTHILEWIIEGDGWNNI